MRKYDEENSACLLSHPVRGAWIEIVFFSVFASVGFSSHPVSVTRIGINHLLLTGRFNAAGACFTDSILEHGVKLHIR